MSLLRRIFGGDKSEPEQPFDLASKQRGLEELSTAIVELTNRMRADEFPVDNPGWKGRIRDLSTARATADALHGTEFTRQDLYDFTTTVRVLYRGDPPREFAALAAENDRVVRALDALMD
ncbi:MAG: hypothetical protein GX596_10975 [Propionibacterium sp.]|nr:hypothetical protein [Propionibacterium sp.]